MKLRVRDGAALEGVVAERRGSRAMRLLVALVVLPGCGAPDMRSEPESSVHEPEGDPGTIVVGGAALRIVWEGVPLEGSPSRIEDWVRRSAEMVVDYCGGAFPVPDLRIEIVVRPYGDIGFGQHFGGRRLRVRVGASVDEGALVRDWVMVHEMLHTALPDLRRRHRWMQEGLSTYLESVTRARAGSVSEDEVWARWMRRLPLGQPVAGDRGLDRTPTWGRVYWGGALFWFTVDVELRRRSGGEVGVENAVRGILAAGGSSRADWSTARVVRVADRATSSTVLTDTYEAQAQRATRVDLDGLFRDLGVGRDTSGAVVFDDDAELAWIRRAITAPR